MTSFEVSKLELISGRLPLAIITILHSGSESVPMLPPTTCSAGRRRSVNSVSTSINQYQLEVPSQLVSSWPILQSEEGHLFRWTWIFETKWLFGCFWIRSRIGSFNKLSEALQFLGLSQYIILFALHQSSSSNSHYKLESMKVQSDLPLERTRFLLISHREWPNICS